MATTQNKNQNRKSMHDYLVDQIKAAGQEMINRAEEMVSGNPKLVTDFNINIHIPNVDELPTISWTTEVICKTGSDIIMGGNY